MALAIIFANTHQSTTHNGDSCHCLKSIKAITAMNTSVSDNMLEVTIGS